MFMGPGARIHPQSRLNWRKENPFLKRWKLAKEFITAAVRHGFKLNEFVGPVRHGAYREFGKN